MCAHAHARYLLRRGTRRRVLLRSRAYVVMYPTSVVSADVPPRTTSITPKPRRARGAPHPTSEPRTCERVCAGVCVHVRLRAYAFGYDVTPRSIDVSDRAPSCRRASNPRALPTTMALVYEGITYHQEISIYTPTSMLRLSIDVLRRDQRRTSDESNVEAPTIRPRMCLRV